MPEFNYKLDDPEEDIDYTLNGIPDVEPEVDYSLDDVSEEPAINYNLDETEDDTERDISEIASDFGTSLQVGGANLVGLVADIYGLTTGEMDNKLALSADEMRESFSKNKTNQLKRMEADLQEKVDAADGEFAKMAATFWGTISSPSLFASTLAEQAPLALTGIIGKGAQAAAIAAKVGTKAATAIGMGTAFGTGAALAGADAGSQMYDDLATVDDELWDLNPNVMASELSREEAIEEEKLRLSRNGAVAAGVMSLGLNAIPGASYLDRALVGKGSKLAGPKLKNMAVGAFGEGLQEVGEEGGAQLIANIGVQQIDPEQETFTGVGQASGLGLVGGAGFGGIAGAARSTQADAQAITAELDTATNVDEILASAESMLETPTGEPISVNLTDIPISRDFSVDGVTETITESADVVLSEIDTRIDNLKLLVKCVS